jgi:molybdopterin-guanine dinucleotide biosynthesis protein A
MGAVLAGGDSRRMGRDKALLEWQGRSLLARAVEELGGVIEEVFIVAPDDRGYADLGVEIVPDLRPGLGPVAGIHAALVRATGRPVFVLACDMPYVGRDLVHWIVDMVQRTTMISDEQRRTQAWVVHDGAGPQPLCGIYAAHSLTVVDQALAENRRSARGLLDSLVTEELTLDPEKSWYRPDLLTSVNDLESLAELTAGRRALP